MLLIFIYNKDILNLILTIFFTGEYMIFLIWERLHNVYFCLDFL